MSTNVSEIKVIGDLKVMGLTSSVANIAKCFHGIKAIHFCDGAENNFVSVYTENLGSTDSEELTSIKNTLNAKSISISTVGVYYEAKGLVYVLNYGK